MVKSYELTDAQLRAFASLKLAIAACQKAGVYLWDDCGTISAVNGKVVACIDTGSATFAEDQDSEQLDRDRVEKVLNPKCWHGSNADDPLYVRRK